MDTSNIEEMRQLSDGPTLIFMFILGIIFIISMTCTELKDD